MMTSEISKARLIQARLAQSVEHETFNLRVVGSSPTLGDTFFVFWHGIYIRMTSDIIEAKSHVMRIFSNIFDGGFIM